MDAKDRGSVQDPSQNHPSLRPPAQRLGPPDHPGGQHRARPHTVRARKGATVGEPRGEAAVGEHPLYTQSSAGDTLRRTNTPGGELCKQILRLRLRSLQSPR